MDNECINKDFSEKKINYNIYFDTTYNEYYTNDGYEEYCGEKYRLEFLKAFNSENYDEKIDVIQMELFRELVNNERLKNVMKKLANKFMSEDLDFGFIFLFSFDYFYLIHKYICSFYKSGIIDENILDKLEKKV